MVQESVEKVSKKPASERAESKTLNVQEGQEPEKEPESQELTDLLRGVRVQCGEVKDLLHKAVGSRGKAQAATQLPLEFSPKTSPGPLVIRSLHSSGEPLLNPSPLELPVAPPPVPVEMRDAQVQAGERNFQGRETCMGRNVPLNGVRGKIGNELAGPVRGAVRGDHVDGEVL
jgi:hypothetical protein